jgi:hypothetical protein
MARTARLAVHGLARSPEQKSQEKHDEKQEYRI